MAQKTIDFENDILGPIGSLKGDLDEVKNVILKVDEILTPITDFTSGYINKDTAEVIESPDASHTDFLDASKKYVITANAQFFTCNIATYDKDKNFIRSYGKGTDSGLYYTNYTYENQSDEVYVRFCSIYYPLIVNRIDDKTELINKYIPELNLINKKVYWDGDSIAYGAGANGNSYADIISNKFYMDSTKMAVGGSSLAKRSGRTDSILERIKTNIIDNSYDFIVLNGGTNDYFSFFESSEKIEIGTLTSDYNATLDETTLIGATESICKHIRTYANESIFLFVIGHRPVYNGSFVSLLDDYWDAIISALEKWAVPYVDIRKEGTLIDYNSEWLIKYFGEGEEMGTHPNIEGYKKFYIPLIIDKMKSLITTV